MRINGNLVFNADATSEIQNAYVERLGSAPAFDSAHKGRLYFNTNTALYYYNDGAAWVPFATGGNAAALQQEVDAIETSLGAAVNSNGTYNGTAAFAGVPVISDASSLTAALIALANEANGTDTLAELGDVQLGTLSNGQYLKFNSTTGKWQNSTLELSNVTDVTASAAEVNILTGATLTTTELNYVDGVTSSIQNQLDNKQPLDAGLTALANFNTNGILVQTANDTFVGRTLQEPTAGIVITNPGGVAGNPAFGLANDLQAVEGLATTGYAVRTGTDTWTTRLISGAADKIVVTNGDGISSNTDIDLATVADSGTGTFKKITRDSYGRVSGTENVVASDITGLVSGIYVDVAGDTMTGNLTMSGGSTVKGLPDPVDGTDAANKNYVDNAVTGLSWKDAVDVLSDANVDITSAPAMIDGATLTNGMRVLLINQTDPFEKGIYVFSAAGSALVRAADSNTADELNGAAVLVKSGLNYENTGWTQNGELSGMNSGTQQSWSQFTGAASFNWGTGLSNTGNTIYVNLGAGIFEGPADAVGLDLYAPASSALILTQDGSTRSDPLNTDAKLQLMLKSAGGLTQDVNGLYIPAAGVTNAMLLNSTVTLNADSGSGSVALGGTVIVEGDSVQGINTLASGNTFSITAADASTSAKGVAKFDQFDFDVTAGTVKVKDGGIDNVQLANSTVGFAGNTGGTFPVALGNSFSVTGITTQGVSTTSDATGVTVTVQNATDTLKGVASFAASDFTVTDGAVTAVAKDLDSLTDVSISNGVEPGSTIIYNSYSNEFVNARIYHLYEGSEATSHTVAHNLGQKYCNVTVVDNTDEVVIPQSITFNGDNSLTVTFTAAIACRIIVMGVQTTFQPLM